MTVNGLQAKPWVRIPPSPHIQLNHFNNLQFHKSLKSTDNRQIESLRGDKGGKE